MPLNARRGVKHVQARWQPIETAPEGTMTLFCSMQTGDVSRWCFVDWLAGGRFMLHPKWDATHWMPLPAAPDPSAPAEPPDMPDAEADYWAYGSTAKREC